MSKSLSGYFLSKYVSNLEFADIFCTLYICLCPANIDIEILYTINIAKNVVAIVSFFIFILFVKFSVYGYKYLINIIPPIPQYIQCKRLVLPFMLNGILL